ncbi:hypothetical protein AGDE_12719 [Angomonas deanei]|uniref:Leucine Rich repeat n=1 Tax=Angomonas deanei TaxID=59799 RepID=A0A7G2C7M4_9TRYP|nr:hypothetical protein AGDE_12719 [Angomonas deanei]CAD2214743.1 hypothetical protein, conserved [Angomonas deanei]|eukprot:EPY23847.1 hypothetical protein AGDE_12719 [Angomonas deanei]
MAGFASLESLDVGCCKNLSSLKGLSGLAKLRTVTAYQSGLQSVEDLSGCLALETLNVTYCKNLTSLNGLSNLPNLRNISTNKSGVDKYYKGGTRCAVVWTVGVTSHWRPSGRCGPSQARGLQTLVVLPYSEGITVG